MAPVTPGERWVKRIMTRHGVRPVGHLDPRDGEDGPVAPATPVVPMQPLATATEWPPASDERQAGEPGEEALVQAPRPGAARLPDWRLPRKPDLSLEEPEELTAPEEPEVPELDGPAPEEADAVASSPVPRANFRTRMREWLETQLVPGEAGETEDSPGHIDGDGDGDQEDGGTEGDSGPRPGGSIFKTVPARWKVRQAARAENPRHRPRFAVRGIPATQERRSLLEAIRSTPDHVKWMTYSGSALGAGFYLGWPQWVRDAVAFLVTEHPSLRDTYSVTCYALAVGVLVLDYRARGWALPFAWAARALTASMVVGVLMYGDPTPISRQF